MQLVRTIINILASDATTLSDLNPKQNACAQTIIWCHLILNVSFLSTLSHLQWSWIRELPQKFHADTEDAMVELFKPYWPLKKITSMQFWWYFTRFLENFSIFTAQGYPANNADINLVVRSILILIDIDVGRYFDIPCFKNKRAIFQPESMQEKNGRWK